MTQKLLIAVPILAVLAACVVDEMPGPDEGRRFTRKIVSPATITGGRVGHSPVGRRRPT